MVVRKRDGTVWQVGRLVEVFTIIDSIGQGLCNNIVFSELQLDYDWIIGQLWWGWQCDGNYSSLPGRTSQLIKKGVVHMLSNWILYLK